MGAAVGEQSAGTASPRQAGDPAPPRPRTGPIWPYAVFVAVALLLVNIVAWVWPNW